MACAKSSPSYSCFRPIRCWFITGEARGYSLNDETIGKIDKKSLSLILQAKIEISSCDWSDCFVNLFFFSVLILKALQTDNNGNKVYVLGYKCFVWTLP